MRKITLIGIYTKIIKGIIKELDIGKNISRGVKGRTNKYTVNDYLKCIMNVLFNGYSWISLNQFYEESTIRKKFYLWKNKGVFKIAYDRLFSIYSKNKTFKDLFIDSSCIRNINCSDEKLQYYYKIKCKKQVKLNMISDNNNVPLAYSVDNPHTHDSQHIKPLIKCLTVKLENNCVLHGDKGYVKGQKKYVHKGTNIKLAIPKKKNQKGYNKKKNIKLNKKRVVVEQTFAHLNGTYPRLRMVYERSLENYMTFLLMSATCQIIRKLY